jgi:Rod binding domain-containing protein
MDYATLTLQARLSGGLDTLQAKPAHAADPKAQYQQYKEIGEGFEGILVRQMLRELRTASQGPESAAANSGYRAMAEDQLADSLVSGGGFGMADAFARQMMGQIKAAELIDQRQKAVNK